jgi:hypothetical protein
MHNVFKWSMGRPSTEREGICDPEPLSMKNLIAGSCVKMKKLTKQSRDTPTSVKIWLTKREYAFPEILRFTYVLLVRWEEIKSFCWNCMLPQQGNLMISISRILWGFVTCVTNHFHFNTQPLPYQICRIWQSEYDPYNVHTSSASFAKAHGINSRTFHDWKKAYFLPLTQGVRSLHERGERPNAIDDQSLQDLKCLTQNNEEEQHSMPRNRFRKQFVVEMHHAI